MRDDWLTRATMRVCGTGRNSYAPGAIGRNPKKGARVAAGPNPLAPNPPGKSANLKILIHFCVGGSHSAVRAVAAFEFVELGEGGVAID